LADPHHGHPGTINHRDGGRWGELQRSRWSLSRAPHQALRE
jgi:hypothetical protein